MSVLDLGGCEAHHSCLFLSDSWLQHSATMQPVRSRGISVKGKKERKFSPFLFLLCCFRRCRAEKCDPWGSLQIVRWGYIEKAEISYRMLCIEKFQIQLAFDTPDFKLPFGTRHYRWCCLKAAESTIRTLPRTQQGWGGVLSMSHPILTLKSLFWQSLFPHKCQN